MIKSSLPVLETVAHHSFLSDHKYVKMELKLPEVVKKAKKKKDRDSGFWKLNSSVLDYEDFLSEYQVMHVGEGQAEAGELQVHS